MQRLSHIAAAAAVTFLWLPASVALAQDTPNTGAGTTTAPAAATAPDATPAAPAATPTDTATPAATNAEPAKTPKKKIARKMTRQQEIDRSIRNGTVPARYRNSVPKEYQHYIPFEKR